MDLVVHSASLPHTDPEASLAFYRDALGFEVRSDEGDAGGRWITLGPAGGTGTSLVLEPAGARPGLTTAERRTIAEMMAKGTYAAITLATADLDALHRRLRDAGAELAWGPTDQPSGVRDCAYRDPAGNLVRITQA
ncbi:VOC family protein [Glycomyces terrestris]|uniref:VOC family protein n=1 Tax=Glycomyces terrestris TaxID=2493553 RepID=A0A426V0W6_9ACTN|nr:VOC family protein [Glycomyces terrestris]RRS00455.1 VOC family protein [Glycomyces terrestris]